jgi:hypothetical protein
MIKFLHPRVAALVSAMMVVLTGNVSHGETMSKNLSRSRPAVPPVQTTKGGSRYVRPIDVLRSIAGRREIARQLRNSPPNQNGSTVKKEVKEKT